MCSSPVLRWIDELEAVILETADVTGRDLGFHNPSSRRDHRVKCADRLAHALPVSYQIAVDVGSGLVEGENSV